MRKIILVAAMVLVSASAQAGGPRSLSLATVNAEAPSPPATTAPVAATTLVSEATPVTDAPKYVDRPSAVSTPAPAAPVTTAAAPASTPVATKPATKTSAKADKPRHKQWTEGRIIAELHRHGIYW